MRSPAWAIAWELRQRHRVALLAFAGYALALAGVWLLAVGPGQPWRLQGGLAAAMVAPFSSAFLWPWR